MNKRGPIIFLITLTIILVFILGIRYGQRVEKTNKAINYFLSLPPTKPPEPTQKPLEFKEFVNKTCGIKFLYPNNFKLKDSSFSGSLSEQSVDQFVFDCNIKSKLLAGLNDPQLASAEVNFKEVKKQVKIATILPNWYNFQIYNTLNAKNIYIGINKSLYPLFEKSLEFVKQN